MDFARFDRKIHVVYYYPTPLWKQNVYSIMEVWLFSPVVILDCVYLLLNQASLFTHENNQHFKSLFIFRIMPFIIYFLDYSFRVKFKKSYLYSLHTHLAQSDYTARDYEVPLSVSLPVLSDFYHQVVFGPLWSAERIPFPGSLFPGATGTHFQFPEYQIL
jgi:hypothetical protein